MEFSRVGCCSGLLRTLLHIRYPRWFCLLRRLGRPVLLHVLPSPRRVHLKVMPVAQPHADGRHLLQHGQTHSRLLEGLGPTAQVALDLDGIGRRRRPSTSGFVRFSSCARCSSPPVISPCLHRHYFFTRLPSSFVVLLLLVRPVAVALPFLAVLASLVSRTVSPSLGVPPRRRPPPPPRRQRPVCDAVGVGRSASSEGIPPGGRPGPPHVLGRCTGDRPPRSVRRRCLRPPPPKSPSSPSSS